MPARSEWLVLASGYMYSVCVCLVVTEAGDEGNSSVSQRCTDEMTTAIDVKCTSLVARDNQSAAAAITSGHVTAANEHDHMVSSTIHSDGQLRAWPSVLCLQ